MTPQNPFQNKGLAVFLLAFFASANAFPQYDSLDKTLEACYLFFERTLPRGVSLALGSFAADNPSLSKYTAEKLRLRFIHDSPFIVSDPQTALVVISGTLSQKNGVYRLRAEARSSEKSIARFDSAFLQAGITLFFTAK